MWQQRKNSSGGRLIRRCPNSDSTVIIPFIKFGPLFGQDEEGSSLKKAKEEAWNHVVSFSNSSTEETVTENYISSLRYIEKKAKNFYDPDPVIWDTLSDTDFRMMMIKDTCLFLQLSFSLLRNNNVDNNYDDDHVKLDDFPHLRNISLSKRHKWVESMLHVGNQIPLVVIRELLKQSYFKQVVENGKWKEPLFDPVKKALFRILLSPLLHREQGMKFPCIGKHAKRLMHWTQELKECCDVLHGIHLLLLGPEIDPEKEEYEDDDDNDDDADKNDDVEENRGASDKNRVTSTGDSSSSSSTDATKKNDDHNNDHYSKVKNVIELKQAGMYFGVTKKGGIRGIRFKSNLIYPKLYLPPLFIGCYTQLLLESMRQYEQNLDSSLGEVSSYLMFMRDLVRTTQDAKILVSDGIVKGNRKYIQKLPDILIDLDPHNDKMIDTNLSSVKIEINSFYHPPWVTSYFTIVFLFTFVGMIISIAQTIYAILAYHKPPPSGS
ncbi:hypothetical protein KY290_016422 [Solanum tuberosum]|uniref:Uncharacterized protein n=1 Tax=Solanum tuberosum TaxID=4113 RepID=A0ABQ7V8G8_SOLTU|nr:hypothetical protein KY290_016422 [Solanum tuberosum]